MRAVLCTIERVAAITMAITCGQVRFRTRLSLSFDFIFTHDKVKKGEGEPVNEARLKPTVTVTIALYTLLPRLFIGYHLRSNCIVLC